jgi:hypothetical protein
MQIRASALIEFFNYSKESLICEITKGKSIYNSRRLEYDSLPWYKKLITLKPYYDDFGKDWHWADVKRYDELINYISSLEKITYCGNGFVEYTFGHNYAKEEFVKYCAANNLIDVIF